MEHRGLESLSIAWLTRSYATLRPAKAQSWPNGGNAKLPIRDPTQVGHSTPGAAMIYQHAARDPGCRDRQALVRDGRGGTVTYSWADDPLCKGRPNGPSGLRVSAFQLLYC